MKRKGGRGEWSYVVNRKGGRGCNGKRMEVEGKNGRVCGVM